jgi:hypothetical protein
MRKKVSCKRNETVRRIIIYGLGLFLWLPGKINAQRVIYSESFNSRSGVHFQLIGKSGDYYWVEKLQRQKSYSRHTSNGNDEIQSVGLLNSKLSLLKEISVNSIAGTEKQWLLADNKMLNQVVLTRSSGKTKIICNQYFVDDQEPGRSRQIDSLPFTTGPSSFLLMRSEDQSKILLIAFDNRDELATHVHALLFDSDWNPIYHQVISNSLLSQPCIQDDEIGFPAESFDNLPVKLANNGEWLMASPSRISRNFSLCHVRANGSDYSFKEIPLSPYYKMEDIAMSVDNDLQEMSVGLLSAYSNTSFKNVQICNYSMKDGKFDFDSSYRFNTRGRGDQNKNLSRESFVAVPGAGYMLLKEYGAAVDIDKPAPPFINSSEAAYLLTNYSESNPDRIQKEGYTLNHGLSPIPAVRNRGDLNLFYFPSRSNDSVWSGIMDVEQHAESNNPELSYLLVPAKDRLFILYNSLNGFADPLATTTTLNIHGQATDDALVFWKMNRMLNFQHPHRFSPNEIAVPYNQQAGFAILKLD